jgi:hypothetical protein
MQIPINRRQFVRDTTIAAVAMGASLSVRAARILAEASAVFARTELAKEGTTLEVPAIR